MIGLLMTSAIAVAAARGAAVEVRIQTDKPTPVNPRVYGIVCAEMFTKGYVDDPAYVEALVELKFKTFLYPGGSASYYHHPKGGGGFNMRPEEIKNSKQGADSRWMKETFGPDHFEQYLKFVKASGGESVFVANVTNGTVAELEEFLERLTAARVPIAAVALGQEMHLGQGRSLTLPGYIDRIKPYIAMMQAKYPHVPIIAPATPLGRRERSPASFHEWNEALARVPGIDGFSQYGWTEFGGRDRGAGRSTSGNPSDTWKQYDQFVADFPTRQVPIYQKEWGQEKKFHVTQWGTHSDQNTPIQGLHVANFYFLLAQYNAAHEDYFATATMTIPLAQPATKGDRKTGVAYKDKVTLFASYLYSKPFRHLFDGDKKLVASSTGSDVKVLAALDSGGKKYVYFLNPGSATPLHRIEIDAKVLDGSTKVSMESAFGAPTGAGPINVLAAEKMLSDVMLEPYSLTLLILP